MNKTEQHIGLLGLRVRDKVTGATGIVTSVCFDLYGCKQAIVSPMVGKDGKLGDQAWYDAERLEIKNYTPVMQVPDFKAGTPQGPETKPTRYNP